LRSLGSVPAGRTWDNRRGFRHIGWGVIKEALVVVEIEERSFLSFREEFIV
jgi:hypothetical protein